MDASEREGTKTEPFSRSALQGRMQCTAGAVAVHCRSGCTALRKRLQCTAGKGYIMAYSDLHYRLQAFPLADKRPILWRTALQAEARWCVI